jgi:hypothetical protein
VALSEAMSQPRVPCEAFHDFAGADSFGQGRGFAQVVARAMQVVHTFGYNHALGVVPRAFANAVTRVDG